MAAPVLNRTSTRLIAASLVAFVILVYLLTVPAAHDPHWWKRLGFKKGVHSDVHHSLDDVIVVDDVVVVVPHAHSGASEVTPPRRDDHPQAAAVVIKPPPMASAKAGDGPKGTVDDGHSDGIIVVEPQVPAVHPEETHPSDSRRSFKSQSNDALAVVTSGDDKKKSITSRPKVQLGTPVNLRPGLDYVVDYDIGSVHFTPFPGKFYNGKPYFQYVDPAKVTAPFSVTYLSTKPMVAFVPNFLTDEECDALVAAAKPGMGRSLVAARLGRPATESLDDVRTSTQTWLSSVSGAAAPIVDRILALTGFQRGQEESMQILRYGVGQKYDAHHDYFDPTMYGAQASNRAATVFLYLNDVEEGGETWWPRADGKPPTYEYKKCDRGLRVHPIKRSIAIFYGMKPNGEYDDHSLHGGCPVKRGEKWGGTLWLRIPTAIVT